MSIVLRVLLFSALIGGAASAQAQESCDAFLLAPRQVKGKPVGPKSCLMQETSASVEGRALTRLVERKDVGHRPRPRHLVQGGTAQALERVRQRRASDGGARSVRPADDRE